MSTPASTPSDSPLDVWIQRCCDGTLTADEARLLNDRLRGDPDACERYLNQMTLHSLLDAEFHPQAHPLPDLTGHPAPGFQMPETKAGLRQPRRSWKVSVVGYGLAACFATAFFLKNAPSPTPVEAGVAILAFAEDCQWSTPQSLEEGSEINHGLLVLKSGTAMLRLHGGAEIMLQGPVSLDLQTAGRATLARGQVVVRSAEDAMGGFHLLTPATTIIDEAGEYTATVTADGSTALWSKSGHLSWSPRDQPNDLHALTGGASIQVDSLGREQRLNETNLTPDSSDWMEKSKPRERPDLMTVYDGFHYDAGRYEPSEIQRGKGWVGPWRLRSPQEMPHDDPDQTTDMEIVHNKLNVVWPIEGGQGGMLRMPPGKTYRIREMAQAIDMNADGIHYFSMMVHQPDDLPLPPRERPLEGTRITFRSSADYLGESLSFGLSDKLHPRIQVRQGEGFVSLAEAPSRQTTLWVGKIVSRDNGIDQISFRIYGEDDPLDFAEPGVWHVQTRNLRHSAALDLVVLTSQGQSSRIIDELRIGPTWRSVAPFKLLLTGN